MAHIIASREFNTRDLARRQDAQHFGRPYRLESMGELHREGRRECPKYATDVLSRSG